MKIINLKGSQSKGIKEAVRILKKGGLIVYPTETCYGIGAEATNPQAVKKLFLYKGNRVNKAISIAVSNKQMAEKYVTLNKKAVELYKKFLPGPLTIISKSKRKVDKRLESKKKTLGVRIPDYPLILQLTKQLGKPITSTSANISGENNPYSIKDLKENTSQKKLQMIDLILDAGYLTHNPPSTVVDTTADKIHILRQGKIIIGLKEQSLVSFSEEETKKLAKKILKENKDKLKKKALVFALQGELGAGKTIFAKGLAQGLGIKQNVPSPSFILVREYPYSLKKQKGIFYHLDTWRIESTQEFENLGLEKMLQPGNILAIEWLKKVKDYLKNFDEKAKIIWVNIDHLDQNKRKIKY